MTDINSTTDVLVTTLSTAVENIANSFADAIPGLLFGIIIFVIGWIIAIVISRIVAGLLKAAKLEEFLKEHRVEDALGTVKISNVLVKILKYYIILIFLQAAVSFVSLGTISDFLTGLLLFVPLLMGAVLVSLVAVILGEYVKEILLDLGTKSPLVRLAARGTKLVIIYVGVVMALATVGFHTELISDIFTIVLQGAVYGIALAIGLAFGLGGQGDAQNMIGTWRKHLKV